MTSGACSVSHDPAVRQATGADASGIELIADAVARPASDPLGLVAPGNVLP